MKRARTVALPRPKGTRATSRVALVITMHPRELAELEGRAAAASLSLRAYVMALLASDADDLPARRERNPRINWLEDVPEAVLLAKRCMKPALVDLDLWPDDLRADMLPATLPCSLPEGHRGPCSATHMRPEHKTGGAS